MGYFNETGPIYQQELVQANEFLKFVHAHVVPANESSDKRPNPESDPVRFDWEGFRVALSSSQDLASEHELCVLVPPYSVDSPPSTPPPATETNSNDADATTVQAVLDALVARFASLFVHALFIPASNTVTTPDSGYGVDEVPRTRAQNQAYFCDVLRRNLYCAFTRHLRAANMQEHYLSVHRRRHPDADTGACTVWEYRLLFVHPDAQSGRGKGLVMTVALGGDLEDQIRRVNPSGDDDEDEGQDNRDGEEDEDEDEVWYGVPLDSKGSFTGMLTAMQVSFGEGFRCP